jgi:hypothetical protein
MRPIFRDRDDFTAGKNLTEQTLAALDSSHAAIGGGSIGPHPKKSDSGSSFRELTDEAFADLLNKHKQPEASFYKAVYNTARGSAVGLPLTSGR